MPFNSHREVREREEETDLLKYHGLNEGFTGDVGVVYIYLNHTKEADLE